jgi:dihydrolipoamide dehydrogenase
VRGAAEAVSGDVDAVATLARRDEVIHDLDDSVMEPWLDSRGIEIFRVPGVLDGERRVKAGDDVLVAEKAVVVATGSTSFMPPIPGLEDAKPWTNREITTAKEVPARIAFLGGGVVGVEMAQAWRSLGSQITLIERGDRLIAREERFAGEQVADSLRTQGVDVRVDTTATAVSRAGSGEVTIELEGGPSVVADELVVAIGRRPRTANLGVDSVGLEPGDAIEVDEQARATGVGGDWLYAVGDVNGRALLTHMGKYQARIAADVILGRDARIESDGALSPRVIFTDPQVAAVGHTLESARAAGLDARAVDFDTEGSAGGSFVGKGAPGTSRLVIDDGRGVIAGATFTGAEVAETIHAATIAVAAEVPLDRLIHAVPSFPTRSENWLYLLEAAGV